MLTAIPTRVRAGDTLRVVLTLSERPAPTWAAVLTLINAAGRITVNGTAQGADHLLSASAATTAAWAAGRYTWTLHVASGGERYTEATGSLEVLPDLAVAATADTRTPARRALDEAEALLATYGSKAYLQEVSYGDRKQVFRAPGEFLSYVSRLRAEVRAEEAGARIAAGLGAGNRIVVRFGRTR